MRRLALVLSLSLTAASCAAGAQEAGPFAGLWESEGFGTYMVIDRGNVDIFEYTSVSCGQTVRGTARGVSELLRFEGERLVLEDGGRLVRFDRIEAVPEHCASDYFVDDATVSFKVLAATVEEHYASDLDAEWVERRDSVASTLSAESDSVALLAAAIELLSPLADAQLQVAPDESAGLGRGSWSIAIDPLIDTLTDRITAGEGLVDPVVEGQGAIVGGRLPSGHGYLAFTRFAAIDAEADEAEQVLLRSLDSLLVDLEENGAPGLVLDLRTATGGVESLALLAATRFVPTDLDLAMREVRVAGTDRFVDAGTSIVRPNPLGVYTGPIAVLIGPGTFGAAEMLLLALLSLDNVTVVGEPTAGSPTQPLIRVLPNTWAFGVPHQRVVVDGVVVDGPISPDVLAVTEGVQLASGTDTGLDAAVAVLSP